MNINAMKTRVSLSALLLSVCATFVTSCSDDEPVMKDPTLTIEVQGEQTYDYDESRTYPLIIEGDFSTAEVTVPEGWTAVIEDNTLTVTAPKAALADKANSGTVNITLKGYGNTDATASFEVKALRVITFEEVGSEYLAGPTAYGENLYNGDYAGYEDPVSKLFFHTTTDGYKFASGGIALSQWNDLTTAGYTNQCSVYYGTENENDGGYDHSQTFAVSFCPTFGESGAYIYYQDETSTCAPEYAYITNNTYAVLSMENGDGFAKKFSYEDQDWFKLTITGVDTAGETTGEVEVYLADFRTADAGGILKEWTKVDLTPLGTVSRINFTMSSSDGSGMWMNTPAYFCIDNLAVSL